MKDIPLITLNVGNSQPGSLAADHVSYCEPSVKAVCPLASRQYWIALPHHMERSLSLVSEPPAILSYQSGDSRATTQTPWGNPWHKARNLNVFKQASQASLMHSKADESQIITVTGHKNTIQLQQMVSYNGLLKVILKKSLIYMVCTCMTEACLHYALIPWLKFCQIEIKPERCSPFWLPYMVAILNHPKLHFNSSIGGGEGGEKSYEDFHINY